MCASLVEFGGASAPLYAARLCSTLTAVKTPLRHPGPAAAEVIRDPFFKDVDRRSKWIPACAGTTNPSGFLRRQRLPPTIAGSRRELAASHHLHRAVFEFG